MARLFAQRGDDVFLLGNIEDELIRSAKDLEIHGATSPVGTAICDLLRPETFAPALERAQRALGGVDTIVVTAAVFATQEELERDRHLAAQLLIANFSYSVLFCEEARERLLPGGGTLCVFSSVAGERARKPVILYGAAKAGLTHYLEGLDHKFRARGLTTVCVKPGFAKTGMTAGLKPPPLAGEPGDIARRVLKAIDRGTPEVYAPAAWALVMRIIRNLPRFVMRRIEF